MLQRERLLFFTESIFNQLLICWENYIFNLLRFNTTCSAKKEKRKKSNPVRVQGNSACHSVPCRVPWNAPEKEWGVRQAIGPSQVPCVHVSLRVCMSCYTVFSVQKWWVFFFFCKIWPQNTSQLLYLPLVFGLHPP